MKRHRIPIVILSVMTGLVTLAGLGFKSFFLDPLSPARLKFPPLQHTYLDQNLLFEMRGPQNWSYEPLPLVGESGVKLRPFSNEDYIGISEVKVLVRKLSSPPPNPEKFLNNIAALMSRGQEKVKKSFAFHVEPADLMSKAQKGVWSILTLKRFFIPLRQITLFGIKEGRYLCTVSATGLEAHSTLSRVMCLGLFETVLIHHPAKKGLQTKSNSSTINLRLSSGAQSIKLNYEV